MPAGRPRIYRDNAEKQAAYRQRKLDKASGDYPTTTFRRAKPGEGMGAGMPRWEGPGREPLVIVQDD
jgi:hypothetical protein